MQLCDNKYTPILKDQLNCNSLFRLDNHDAYGNFFRRLLNSKLTIKWSFLKKSMKLVNKYMKTYEPSLDFK